MACVFIITTIMKPRMWAKITWRRKRRGSLGIGHPSFARTNQQDGHQGRKRPPFPLRGLPWIWPADSRTSRDPTCRSCSTGLPMQRPTASSAVPTKGTVCFWRTWSSNCRVWTIVPSISTRFSAAEVHRTPHRRYHINIYQIVQVSLLKKALTW